MKEEKTGRAFASPDEAAAFAKTACPPAVWVETADGLPEEELLLRHYQDGSVVVLGLGAKEHGKLRLLRRGSEPVPFTLPARGVFVWRGDGSDPAPDRQGNEGAKSLCVLAPLREKMDVSLSAANTCRLAFGTNRTARLKVEHPVEDARLVLRSHPALSAVTLDGRPVRAEQPCDALRQGLNGLYRQTAPFSLAAGEHTFAIAAGGSDTNYFLPVAWLTGSFAVERGALTALPRTAGAGALWRHGLAGFAGSVTYSAQVDVPAEAGNVRLRLNTGGLFTAVTLGGLALGERAWAPFEWGVPEAAKGKRAELKITVWTSVAPLFGDWRRSDAAWSKKFWVPPPEPRPEVGLLALPEWVSPSELP